MREPGSPINLAICVPTHTQVEALFAYDLAQMMAFTTAVMPENCSIGLHMNIGTYIHKSRTELLQDAIANNCSHILWLDSDMRFPQDMAIRLLQRETPFVGINYSLRAMPPDFVGVKRVPRGTEDPTDGERLITNDNTTGLEECDVLGFGGFMMDATALVGLPDPKYDPWFWFDKNRNGTEIGEDAYFCLRIIQERLKHRIFCDHDLSKECSHIGNFEYKVYHAEAANEAKTEALAALEGDDAASN